MPVSPANITYDLSSLPVALQLFITNLDIALTTGWSITERSRQITFEWATYGGFTQPKLEIIRKIMSLYRQRGWLQAEIVRNQQLSNQTQITFVFEY